jgi:hypothetical protein
MTDPPQNPTRFSLRRWSQRKLEATRNADAGQAPLEESPSTATAASNPPRDAGSAEAAARIRSDGGAPALAAPAAVAPAAEGRIAEAAQPLPSIESLSIDSDFSPFMQPGVDEDLKRSALRKLMRDPRFNVMDGLDVYIDDYSKPDPIDPAIVRTLMQARYIFNPPKTRVNAEGHVEDVPVEDPQADAAGEAAETAGDANPVPASMPVEERPASQANAAAAPPFVTTGPEAAVDPAPLHDSKPT